MAMAGAATRGGVCETEGLEVYVGSIQRESPNSRRERTTDVAFSFCPEAVLEFSESSESEN